MAVATIVHIEASMGLVTDLLSETLRALLETYSELKPLPLPTFEGEVQEYVSYRELFTIHVDRGEDLDEVSKFTYLLGTLDKEPLRVVKSLSVTAANYRFALDLLHKQYGNVHQRLVILHRKLANIFVPSLDPLQLKRIRFELTIIIEQIKRLSKDDIGQGMVMSLINQKLSEGKLYRKVVEHLRKCDYTLDEFFDAIDFIIRMLEDDALQRGDKLEHDKRKDNSVRPKSTPVHNNSCPFCSERHPPHGCRQVTDVAARRRILLKRGLCFNCTKSGVEKVDGINLFLTHNGMSPYGKVPQWLFQGEKVEQVRTLRVCKIMNEPYQFDVDEWWRLDHVGI
ncbi:uncharacterized protein [Palaemon carinicauda]|uniref:uncharacterized protein n=1 Tax=Palaemon carinicauda TaxID=392227 RepID=UPI0035B5D574